MKLARDQRPLSQPMPAEVLSINTRAADGAIKAAQPMAATTLTNHMNRIGLRQKFTARSEPPRVGRRANVPALMFTTSGPDFIPASIDFPHAGSKVNQLNQSGLKGP
jgi:hypothetical protein